MFMQHWKEIFDRNISWYSQALSQYFEHISEFISNSSIINPLFKSEKTTASPLIKNDKEISKPIVKETSKETNKEKIKK
jgi:hypothetical protein